VRVTKEHYDALGKGLVDTLLAHQMHPFMVNCERHMWDCFHMAWREKRIDGKELYKHYTDANLLTAMRKIFKR